MRGERTGGHRARNLAGALAPHEERVCRELVPRNALDETGRLYRVEPCLGWVKRFTPQSCLVRSRFGRFTGARYKTTALQRARARGTSNNERVLLEKSGREEGRGVSSQYGREGGGSLGRACSYRRRGGDTRRGRRGTARAAPPPAPEVGWSTPALYWAGARCASGLYWEGGTRRGRARAHLPDRDMRVRREALLAHEPLRMQPLQRPENLYRESTWESYR